MVSTKFRQKNRLQLSIPQFFRLWTLFKSTISKKIEQNFVFLGWSFLNFRIYFPNNTANFLNFE